MIHFIVGKPRGGKTLYSVRLMIHELLYGKRHIITNVSLDLGRLNEYVQNQSGDRVVDVIGRVILLRPEEGGKFWTYRPGCRIAILHEQQWEQHKYPDYSQKTDSGVLYCIDELHVYFGARQWAETGRDVLYYLSQHAKLGDTFIGVTQSISFVDKQFRALAQDFTVIRNLSKERRAGFRMPGLFLRRTYLGIPSPTAECLEMGTFKLDVSGIASCYRTEEGVGIHGAGDKKETVGGRHWLWFVVGLIVLVLLVAYGVPRVVGAMFKTPIPQRVEHKAAGPPVPVATNNQTTISRSGELSERVGVSALVGVTNRVRLVGLVRLGAYRQVSLSDGRVLTGPRIQAIGDSWAIVDGYRYEF